MWDSISRDGVAYMDTDGFYTDTELPQHLVGTGLGQMKEEGRFDFAVFIRPKVYYTAKYDSNGELSYNYKFKGVPDRLVKLEYYNTLYEGKQVEINMSRLYKSRGGGLVEKESVFTFQPPDNSKRMMIFDSEKRWVGTQPLVLGDDSDQLGYVSEKSVSEQGEPEKDWSNTIDGVTCVEGNSPETLDSSVKGCHEAGEDNTVNRRSSLDENNKGVRDQDTVNGARDSR